MLFEGYLGGYSELHVFLLIFQNPHSSVLGSEARRMENIFTKSCIMCYVLNVIRCVFQFNCKAKLKKI